MKIKRIISVAMASLMMLGSVCALSGCDTSYPDTTTTTQATDASTASASTEIEIVHPEVNPLVKKDTENKVGYQLEMPEDGEEIAIIHTKN